MTKFLILFIFSFCTLNTCYGQKMEKVLVYDQDPYDLYATEGKDSTSLFYQKIIPRNKPIGVLVIIPGAGETIEEVMQQTSLHTLAVEKDLLVVFPSINWGTVKYEAETEFLNTIFKQLVEKHKVAKDKFVLTGFSGGAMLSLRYTEKANETKGNTFIIPKAVVGIDPPLDFAHLWDHCKRDVERNFSEPAVREGKWIMNNYIKEFGGSPEEYAENYIKYSIYSHGKKDGGNAQYLKNTPIRLYTEPDILWQIENRHRDFYDMNCVDISAMINLLQLLGNKDAGLIITHGKGIKPDGRRHPHSWSIMDAKESLDWILNQLNK